MGAFDIDGRVAEIRPGSQIPLAELHDVAMAAVFQPEIPTERTGEPQRLQLQLEREFRCGNLLERERRMPYAF